MIDEILHGVPWIRVGFGLFVVYILYGYYTSHLEEQRIQKLAGRAAKRKGRLPFSLDLLFENLQAASRHEILEWWQALFDNYGNPNNPYTIEAGDGPRRVILTADPENIKAILATQFQDYGKGANFNRV
jgi:hypothetical protein